MSIGIAKGIVEQILCYDASLCWAETSKGVTATERAAKQSDATEVLSDPDIPRMFEGNQTHIKSLKVNNSASVVLVKYLCFQFSYRKILF